MGLKCNQRFISTSSGFLLPHLPHYIEGYHPNFKQLAWKEISIFILHALPAANLGSQCYRTSYGSASTFQCLASHLLQKRIARKHITSLRALLLYYILPLTVLCSCCGSTSSVVIINNAYNNRLFKKRVNLAMLDR